MTDTELLDWLEEATRNGTARINTYGDMSDPHARLHSIQLRVWRDHLYTSTETEYASAYSLREAIENAASGVESKTGKKQKE